MVGPVHPGMHWCGRCGEEFPQKAALNEHMRNHPDAEPPPSICKVCNWKFTDQLALESHQLVSGHGAAARCNECGKSFDTMQEFNSHRVFPSPCHDFRRKSPPRTDYKSQSSIMAPKSPTPARSLLSVNKTLTPSLDLGTSSENPPSVGPPASGSSRVPCEICKETFSSQASFNRHRLGCVAKSGALLAAPVEEEVGRGKRKRTRKRKTHQNEHQQAEGNWDPEGSVVSSYRPERAALHGRPPVYPLRNDASNTGAGPVMQPTVPASVPLQHSASSLSVTNQLAKLSVVPKENLSTTSRPNQFLCNVNGCQKTFASKGAFEVHRMDIHGIGSGIFTPHMRQQLAVEGLLRPDSSAAKLGARHARVHAVQGPDSLASVSMPHSAPTFSARPALSPAPHPVIQTVAPGPSPSIPGPAELDQAYEVTEKVARLMISTQICFEKDGSFTCAGQSWPRITIEKQSALMEMLDNLVHLRKLPQNEQADHHMLPAKVFADSGRITYPPEEFTYSPDPNPSALSAIAIVCSKILLQNEQYEVVKIAAVDVLSCRILVDHLVCSDPQAPVKDWFPPKTGLNSFELLEQARESGYKILKGWKAARKLLYKFVDKNTIIIGQDLRRDLGALRMVHGRSIDIAKVVEKAAGGPLSKQQLSIASILRTFMGIELKADPVYGWDVLQLAFAVRGMAMWAGRNGQELTKKAKAASLDYQRTGGI